MSWMKRYMALLLVLVLLPALGACAKKSGKAAPAGKASVENADCGFSFAEPVKNDDGYSLPITLENRSDHEVAFTVNVVSCNDVPMDDVTLSLYEIVPAGETRDLELALDAKTLETHGVEQIESVRVHTTAIAEGDLSLLDGVTTLFVRPSAEP